MISTRIMTPLSSSSPEPEIAPAQELTAEPDIPAEIPDNHPDLLNDPEYQAALEAEKEANGLLDNLNEEAVLNGIELAADVAGIADPTPISDAIAAGIALKRGDWIGAGLSVVSWVPWLGDAIAKPVKGSRMVKRTAVLAAKMKKAADKARKAAKQRAEALKRAKERLKKKRQKKADAEVPPKDKTKDGAKVKYKAKGPECFNAPDGVDPDEFLKQLKEQEDAINNMSAQTMLDIRAAIEKAGGTKSLRDPKSQVAARKEYREEREADLFEEGLSRDKIKSTLDKEMKGLDATHTLDIIAGGDPTNISGMGDKTTNRSMGAQWRGARAQSLEDLAKEMKENGKAGGKMKVKLKKCK